MILLLYIILLNLLMSSNVNADNISDLPKWDLSEFYQSIDSEEIKIDLSEVESQIEYFCKKYSNIHNLSGSALYNSIQDYESIDKNITKIGIYISLLKSVKMNDPDVAIAYQNISEKISDLSKMLLFYDLSIIKMDDDILEDKFIEEPLLLNYKPWFRDLRLVKKHTLSEDLEQLMISKSVTGSSAWVRLFDETMTKLRFDFKGDQVNENIILDKLSSSDESERKEAYYSLGKTLRDNSDLFAMITNILAKDKAINDELRGFARPISSRNLSNYILDDSVVDLLINTVKKNYNIVHKYYNLKAKLFGKDTLDPWNVKAPISIEEEQVFSWDEAKKIVVDSYTSFSSEMGEMSRRFFDENWIDAAVCDGKQSGAFAMSAYKGMHPFVLTNFQGKARDIMTISHEIGHGIHFMYSETQGILMQDAPLILAETASIFGEQLTFVNLMKKIKSDKEKFYLLAEKIEDTLGAIFRQIMFASFETRIHDERKNGELSKEKINEIWIEEASKDYFDSIVEHGDDDYKYFWSYIPHFIHTPFYVYSYAFGNCFVNALYDFYMKNPGTFVEKYKEILSAGGTLHYDEIMKNLDMDPKSENFWQNSLNNLRNMVDEFEKIGKNIGLL